MKKIIILSDTDEPRYGLISHLKELFPKCEIQIVPRTSERIEEGMINVPMSVNQTKSGETIT
jgi:hypothetical protein